MATDLTPDNEHFVEEAVADGHYDSEQDLINEAVRLLRNEMSQEKEPENAMLPADQWEAELKEWAGSHSKLNHPADDDRLNLY